MAACVCVRVRCRLAQHRGRALRGRGARTGSAGKEAANLKLGERGADMLNPFRLKSFARGAWLCQVASGRRVRLLHDNKDAAACEAIFDENTPPNVRKIIFEQLRDVAKAKAETAVAEAKAENIALLRDLDSLTNSLEKSQSRLNCMTPRAILEYVECWVMPISTIKESREKRWQHFLTETKTGKDISLCILRENKQWQEHSLAKRIIGLYQHTSDSIHSQSHDIHTTQKVVLEKLGLTAQAFNAASCIASSLDLKIESAHQIERN